MTDFSFLAAGTATRARRSAAPHYSALFIAMGMSAIAGQALGADSSVLELDATRIQDSELARDDTAHHLPEQIAAGAHLLDVERAVGFIGSVGYLHLNDRQGPSAGVL